MRKVTPKTDEMMETGPIGPKKSKEPIKIYPHIRLEHQFFPETKKCEVGKTCTVTLELKATGLSISRFQNDTEFDIVGFEAKEMNKGKGMDKGTATMEPEESDDDD